MRKGGGEIRTRGACTCKGPVVQRDRDASGELRRSECGEGCETKPETWAGAGPHALRTTAGMCVRGGDGRSGRAAETGLLPR